MIEYKTYKPDSFVIIKIRDANATFYKVLGGWSGGYLDGDSWRINSGIDSYSEQDGIISFHGYSGSTYVVAVDNERVTMIMSGVLGELVKRDDVEHISYKQFKE